MRDDFPDFNPYAPPKTPPAAKPADRPGRWRAAAATVPASRGLRWSADAWRIVWERPGLWLGASLFMLLASGGTAFWLGHRLRLDLVCFLDPLCCALAALMVHAQYRNPFGSAGDILREAFAAFFRRLHHILPVCCLLGILSRGAWTLVPSLIARSRGEAWLADFVGLFPSIFLFALALVGLQTLFAALVTLYAVQPPVLVAVGAANAWQGLWRGVPACLKNPGAYAVNALFALPAVWAAMAARFHVFNAAMQEEHKVLNVGELLNGPEAFPGLLLLLCLDILPQTLLPLVGYHALRDALYEEA